MAWYLVYPYYQLKILHSVWCLMLLLSEELVMFPLVLLLSYQACCVPEGS